MNTRTHSATFSSFLYQVVARLHKMDSSNLQNQYWVVPTRRAGVFLREALAKYFQTTIWAPRIFSIQDFIRSLTEWQFPESLPLIFELYQVYHHHLSKQGFDEPFEQFYGWGEMLLRDFDEIDKYEVNAVQLFRNIKDIKEIEAQFNLPEEHSDAIQRFWKTIYTNDKQSPSYIQQQFLTIWEKLSDIYQDYQQHLLEKGFAYDGMAYRWVSNQLRQGTPLIDASQVVFIGFNALSLSEERIIEYLLDHQQAQIFWDVDKAYFKLEEDQPLLTSPITSKFIQQYHEKWHGKGSHLILHDMSSEPKTIYIEGVALPSGQAHYLGNLLQDKHIPDHQLRNHAVILADETLLFPTLNSLPPTIQKLNITMGFPLRQTPVYHLLISLSQLLRHMTYEGGECLFNYHDVLTILGNAYIQTFSHDLTHKLRTEIIHKNMLLVPASYLQEQSTDGILSLIFTPPVQPRDTIPYFMNIFDMLIKDSQSRKAHLEAEYIFQLYKQFNQFRDILALYQTELTFYGFSRLFRETMSKARIPFEGEPLSGLQLMGFLETRVLDFEHIYVLGANEGNLPDTSTANSYIPYVLRRGFGLPTYEEKDTIYAYHFFRLIQRSRHVHLIYNTIIKDNGGAGEISRYLQQIKYYFRDHPNIKVVERQINTPVPYQGVLEINIPQDEHIQHILKRRYVHQSPQQPSTHYFSATALTTYLACSLRFYFKYIANIKEPELIEEYMEAGTFGKVLHESLELLYQAVDGMIDSEYIHKLASELPKALRKTFVSNDLDWDHPIGMNYLFKEALLDLAASILSHDAQSPPFEIKYLEENVEFDTQFSVGGMPVRLNGTFDRVDYLPDSNTTRIIDYKTGRANIRSKLEIDKLFESDDYKEMFQGYFYAWLYRRKYPENPVQMAFYPLREIQKGREYINNGQSLNDQLLVEFEKNLSELLTRIFTEPFTQVANEEKCLYCAYKTICNRG